MITLLYLAYKYGQSTNCNCNLYEKPTSPTTLNLDDATSKEERLQKRWKYDRPVVVKKEIDKNDL